MIAIFKEAMREGGNPRGQYDGITEEEKARALKALEAERKHEQEQV